MAIQFYVVSRYLENRISVGNKNNAPTKRKLITSCDVITDLLRKRAPQSREKPQLAG